MEKLYSYTAVATCQPSKAVYQVTFSCDQKWLLVAGLMHLSCERMINLRAKPPLDHQLVAVRAVPMDEWTSECFEIFLVGVLMVILHEG